MKRTCLDILPAAQRALWPQLQPLRAMGFVLYGGTAIALRLGHRESVDFDFFASRPLERQSLLTALPFLPHAVTLQDQPDSWTVLAGRVKLSFFGGIGFGRVGDPEESSDGMVLLASLPDLLATKLKALLQRVEAKDYRDVAALLDAGCDLACGLAAARLLYGSTFQPAESLKALVYFSGGDLHTLPAAVKNRLAAAVKDVRALPDIRLRAATLA